MSRKRSLVLLSLVLFLVASALLVWLFKASVLASMILTVIALYVSALIIAGVSLIGLSALVYLTLPRERRRHYRSHKTRLVLVVFSSVTFCAATALFVNGRFLPGRFEPISLFADAVILFFSIFAGWTFLVYRRRALILSPATLLLVIVLGVVAVINSTTRTASNDASLKNLAALPYVMWAPVEESEGLSGVVHHDEGLAYEGINIYNPRNLPTAYLMDMSGEILHTWSAKIHDDDSWVYIEMLPNGDLLAIVDEIMLIKLDWDSNVIWTKDIRVHHDMVIKGDGKLVILTMRPDFFRVRGVPILVRDEQITFLSETQDVTKQISFTDLLRDLIPSDRYLRQYLWFAYPPNFIKTVTALRDNNYEVSDARVFDLFHSNTVEIIDRDFDNIFRQGNILFCIRNLHVIGVVDPVTDKLLWTWGSEHLNRPHHPTLLDNGHILVFDNGTHRGFSRVVVMDPSTNEITWEYRSDPPEEFFTMTRGGNQRLPNGNTLITCSDKGYAFEVTENGEIVWEFFNPETTNGSRSIIYRLMRITNPEDYPCLQRLES
jgi:hypothetical protein